MNQPLSTEKLSVGSPAMFHALMATGSPKVSRSEKLSDLGIPLFFTDSIQAEICSCKNHTILKYFVSRHCLD